MYYARDINNDMEFVREGGQEMEDSPLDMHERRQKFEQLITPLWSQLARYCNAIAGDRETAQDLMSETLLAAYRHFHRLRNEAAFKGYLFRIAARLNRYRIKHAKLHVSITSELAETLERNILKNDGLAAERALEVEELYEALKLLPEAQREAVVLFEISGLSLKEIRKVQGGTLSGVKSRIARGRQELANILGASEKKALSIPDSVKAEPARPEPARTAQPFIAYSLKVRS